ncbi:hypothetical protein LI951_02130 [Enterococcus sp. BWT-B8]|uniref:hypothetical protein n=1 Tax=Enterococcus sp. BWT-B8 TaxID=2885157 RepID=UPI001E564CD8|nr:hypothetical protein [Enterococcus sp. BWT-B8]MCB5950861.1 hypothetical protein [Enterococcus sp. BWT-B8]
MQRVIAGANLFMRRVIAGVKPFMRRVIAGARPFMRRVIAGARPFMRRVIAGASYAKSHKTHANIYGTVTKVCLRSLKPNKRCSSLCMIRAFEETVGASSYMPLRHATSIRRSVGVKPLHASRIVFDSRYKRVWLEKR